MKLRALPLLLLFAAIAASCSGSEVATAATASTTTDSANAAPAAANDQVDDSAPAAAADDSAENTVENAIVDAVDQAQETSSTGLGAATITVGDLTWTFEVLTCTLGFEDDDGQILGPSVAGGFAMDMTSTVRVVNDDDFGDSASVSNLDDDGPTRQFDSSTEFTEVTFDGDDFSGTGEFIETTSDSLDRIPGTFSGTCP